MPKTTLPNYAISIIRAAIHRLETGPENLHVPFGRIPGDGEHRIEPNLLSRLNGWRTWAKQGIITSVLPFNDPASDTAFRKLEGDGLWALLQRGPLSTADKNRLRRVIDKLSLLEVSPEVAKTRTLSKAVGVYRDWVRSPLLELRRILAPAADTEAPETIAPERVSAPKATPTDQLIPSDYVITPVGSTKILRGANATEIKAFQETGNPVTVGRDRIRVMRRPLTQNALSAMVALIYSLGDCYSGGSGGGTGKANRNSWNALELRNLVSVQCEGDQPEGFEDPEDAKAWPFNVMLTEEGFAALRDHRAQLDELERARLDRHDRVCGRCELGNCKADALARAEEEARAILGEVFRRGSISQDERNALGDLLDVRLASLDQDEARRVLALAGINAHEPVLALGYDAELDPPGWSIEGLMRAATGLPPRSKPQRARQADPGVILDGLLERAAGPARPQLEARIAEAQRGGPRGGQGAARRIRELENDQAKLLSALKDAVGALTRDLNANDEADLAANPMLVNRRKFIAKLDKVLERFRPPKAQPASDFYTRAMNDLGALARNLHQAAELVRSKEVADLKAGDIVPIERTGDAVATLRNRAMNLWLKQAAGAADDDTVEPLGLIRDEDGRVLLAD